LRDFLARLTVEPECGLQQKRPQMGKSDELETIWEVPDDLWTEVKRALDEVGPDPKGRHGRPRIDPRRAAPSACNRLLGRSLRNGEFIGLAQEWFHSLEFARSMKFGDVSHLLPVRDDLQEQRILHLLR
jgi:hypothetical protein